jgi:LL-diaminopimelate aminotransferase
MPQASQRLQNLPPYVFSVIGDQIRQMTLDGADVIRLDIGNPDLPPPDSVVSALSQSAQHSQNHGYTGYRGLPGFRQAMAEYYKNRFQVDLHPDRQVLPVIGSKEGIVNLALAYLGAGDVALVPDIGYPSYAMGAQLAGGDVYSYKLDASNRFIPDLASIPADILRRAKILWLNYPNNPTGATVSVETYDEVRAFCHEHDILMASDNPYMDVTYDDYDAPSALQNLTETSHTVEFFSFSKSYNMAGWRLGAALGSAEALKNLLSIKSNIDSGHFKPIYEAGIQALNTPQSWLDDRNQTYQKRRDTILSALPHLGLEADCPKGSLYVWAKILNGMTSSAYTQSARKDAHVSLAPGDAYGSGGNGYVRISLGVPQSRLEQALDRLRNWYQGIS